MDPEDNKNLIFSFRNTHLAQKVSYTHAYMLHLLWSLFSGC